MTPLIGLFVFAIYGVLAVLLASPIALFASYALAALNTRKQGKRSFRAQLGVFALAQLAASIAVGILIMATASFSAGDGHVDTLGIDVFTPWLWIPPLCFDAAIILVGEVAIAFIRSRAAHRRS